MVAVLEPLSMLFPINCDGSSNTGEQPSDPMPAGWKGQVGVW
jgi:hypothetical protein